MFTRIIPCAQLSASCLRLIRSGVHSGSQPPVRTPKSVVCQESVYKLSAGHSALLQSTGANFPPRSSHYSKNFTGCQAFLEISPKPYQQQLFCGKKCYTQHSHRSRRWDIIFDFIPHPQRSRLSDSLIVLFAARPGFWIDPSSSPRNTTLVSFGQFFCRLPLPAMPDPPLLCLCRLENNSKDARKL